MEFEPDSVYLPAPQSSHVVVPPTVCLYFPGVHETQLEEPALEKPVPHDVHVSVAPMLYVFTGHSTAAVRSSLALYPTGTTRQTELAMYSEYSPGFEHVAQLILPPKLAVPGRHGMHSVRAELE
jgi:hypothetical protein